MKCEKCLCEHDGTYGTGRFCSIKCARGFATLKARADINKKVSLKLTGKTNPHPGVPHTESTKLKIKENHLSPTYPLRHTVESLLKTYFVKGKPQKIPLKYLENFRDTTKCEECSQPNEWNNKPLRMQIDHINGDTTDNRLENLRVLCPNCHTQTDTWGRRKRKTKEA